jgi:L-lactate dehydrogenase (cytochrome)
VLHVEQRIVTGHGVSDDRAIRILSDQIVRTMKRLGAHSLEELGPEHVTQLERLQPRPRT